MEAIKRLGEWTMAGIESYSEVCCLDIFIPFT